MQDRRELRAVTLRQVWRSAVNANDTVGAATVARELLPIRHVAPWAPRELEAFVAWCDAHEINDAD